MGELILWGKGIQIIPPGSLDGVIQIADGSYVLRMGNPLDALKVRALMRIDVGGDPGLLRGKIRGGIVGQDQLQSGIILLKNAVQRSVTRSRLL